MTTEPPRTPRPPGDGTPSGEPREGASSTPGRAPWLHAVLATLASVILPGLGHLLFRLGRRRVALMLLIPSVVVLLVAAAWALLEGAYGILAILVAPGVLSVAFGLNALVAAWRALAALDALRRTRPGLLAGGASLLILLGGVALPHVLAASAISAASDFLDATFASEDATPAPIADATLEPTPGETSQDIFATDSPLVSPSPSTSDAPSASPTFAIPPFPTNGGNGSLPAFGAATPWPKPGAQPWGDDGRFDLLLIGSDAGTDRWSRRTDTMILVEVDVATGKVAMVGLPRNLQNAPYPPGAARDASPCGCQPGLLNEMYVEATARHPGLWPGNGAVKGIGAVRSVVSEITGRPIDAVLIVDLVGVIRVVDAMGGIDINVPQAVHDDHYPDPIKGDIVLNIKAGKQHMDGRTALAYARSRHQDSDYARMVRQQTLLLAIRDQLGPATIFNAPALFGAAKGTAWTDLPRSSLPALVELFGKAATAKVRQLRIVPPTYPSYLTAAWVTRIRMDVAALLPGTPTPARSSYPLPVAAPTPKPTPRPTPKPTPKPTATAPPGSSPPSESPTPEPAPTPTPAPPEPTPTPLPEPTPTPTPPSP
jgi:LCP family protein required for cell wall assembly